ncbi:LAME_0H04324g1_1 [Lachancea meyersii CBS 8951]|uniref:Mitochondrial import inner membrane translocase subunit TIM54 n=1 Tax=Lachancea meyersii CBS 8951 TaxID=1266667 RepID=A0A1G4KDW4_9SACH|nr:LAME_0H04324g1_1 [Lachancea meyersii CBS 8951]
MSASEIPGPAADVTAKVKKPGYTNPAFKAMGIPPLRVPSRNWMIFWTVLTVSISGIVYDKRQQKKITEKWCKAVEPLSRGKLDVNEKPRKITVFVAPPPSDYLDTSMTVWRRFVKPVLFSSGLDYEVFTEEKQGLIRAEVAERIRELRRNLLQQETELKRLEGERKLWSRCKNAFSKGINSMRATKEIDEEQEKLLALKFKAEFDLKNLLGVFLKNPDRDLKVVSRDALVSDPVMAGGVICIGRGAYKEYINGIHEGILGPLDPPKKPEPVITEVENQGLETSETNGTSDKDQSPQESFVEIAEDSTEKTVPTNSENTNEAPTNSEETTEVPKPVISPYISPSEYGEAKFPRELTTSKIIRELDTQIPAIFHQPILVLPMHSLSGFLNIPERIYRFYRKRYEADAFCRATASCVLQKARSFEPTIDLDLALAEEADWPEKWVKQGKEKGSEWVSEVRGDERVLKLLHVFEPSTIED